MTPDERRKFVDDMIAGSMGICNPEDDGADEDDEDDDPESGLALAGMPLHPRPSSGAAAIAFEEPVDFEAVTKL